MTTNNQRPSQGRSSQGRPSQGRPAQKRPAQHSQAARSSSQKRTSSRRDDYYEDDYYEDDYYEDSRASRGRKSTPSKKSSNGKNHKKKNKTSKIILFIVEILVLLLMVMVLWTVLKTEKVGKVDLPEEDIVINPEVEKLQEQEGSVLQGYRNIALFGVDSTEGALTKNTRSDTIMIASINLDTGDCKLVSVYRDTYLNLSNDTYNKCNAAYAKGGPEMALGMINMNTDLYVTDYITVGFEGLMEAVDALGGVEIDVKENEISHLNNYQISMAGTSEDQKTFTATAGVDYEPVTEPGLQTLNGLQATAYCRIRYVGDDFERTKRQRDVLIAMMEKAKGASVGTLMSAMNAVLPHVVTSIDVEDIAAVLSKVGDYKVTVSDGFPFAGMRAGASLSVGACVVPMSLADNVVRLHEILYAEENYEPSAELKSFSAQIEADTKDRLQN